MTPSTAHVNRVYSCFWRLLKIETLTLLVALGMPIQATAQFTLTGRLVEELPGGGAPEVAYVTANLVEPTGAVLDGKSITDCVGAETADCVQPDGRFSLSDLQPGLYLVTIQNDYDNAGYLDKSFNATIGGNTDIGIVSLIRAPLDVEITLAQSPSSPGGVLAQIPSSGGTIPVSARVRTRWQIPDLPLTAHFTLQQWPTAAFVAWTPSIDFTWPAGLADSGVVALPPISVKASAPAGESSCVFLTIVLRNQPDVVLGRARKCGGKQP